MSVLFLELARTVLFLSSSPHTFRLRMISSMVVLAPHGYVAKTLLVVRLATHKLIVSVDAVVGVEFLATTLAENTWPLCCHNLCWLGVGKDLKALSQTLQGWTLSLSCDLSPHSDPIQQQHEFPHKPALKNCRTFCVPTTWPGVCLAVFLRDSRLHGPPICDLTGWTFFKRSCHSGCTVLANRPGWQVAGDLVRQEAPHDSWCWVFVYLSTVVV